MKKTLYVVAIFGYLAGLVGALGFAGSALDCTGFNHDPFSVFNMWDHPVECFANGVRLGMGIMLLASLLVLIAYLVRIGELGKGLGKALIDSYPLSAIEIVIAIFALACFIQPAIFGIAFLIFGIILTLFIIVWVAGHT